MCRSYHRSVESPILTINRSNGSQFFICYVDTQLPAEYTVFGTLDPASNQLVADAAAAGTVEGGEDGTPATAVDITTATLD